MTAPFPTRPKRSRETRKASWLLPGVLGLVALAAPAVALAQTTPRAPKVPTPPTDPKTPAGLVVEKTGSLPTRDWLRLRLVTDLGNVHIQTRNSGQVSYRVRIEADPSQPDAENLLEQFVVSARSTPEGVRIAGSVPWRYYRGRLSVDFEVNVPRNYIVDVTTQAGDIHTEDVAGQVSLVTAGGNILTGQLGGAARLETQGGHIHAQDVAGSLQATTAGGHIYVGKVNGDATLRTGGGHVVVETVQGLAQMETGGGNISVLRAGSGATAVSGGGRIDLGEVSGAIRATTGGGGIQVVRLTGPTQLQTSGGSIYLTRVQSAVRASTVSGSITAWFAPEDKLPGGSLLECGNGDILVYLPRALAITIDAVIDMAAGHSIDVDPELPLKVSYTSPGPGPRTVRGEAELNGGGEVLRLRTVGGNIRLRFSDSMREQYQRLYDSQLRQFEQRRDREKKQRKHRHGVQPKVHDHEEELEEQQERQREELEKEQTRLEKLEVKLRKMISGHIRVDAEEQKDKLVHKVRPVYPEVARRNRIQDVVLLEALIDKEGRVENVKVVSGHPELAQAAVGAVRGWRYLPTYVEGEPVAVVTPIRVEFRLR